MYKEEFRAWALGSGGGGCIERRCRRRRHNSMAHWPLARANTRARLKAWQ